MTTDNRTNEMIVAEAMADAGAPLMHSRVEEAVVEALRTAGRLAGEPNKYAGFLARQNHQRDPWRGIGTKCLCGKVFDLDADHALHQVDEILGAALEAAAIVAAQGAAPQAEIHEPNHDRVYCVRCGGNWPCQPAPVLPSSTAPQDPERIMLHHPDGTPKSNDEIRSEAAAMREGAAPEAEALPSNRENCPGNGGHAGCGEFCSLCYLTAPVLPSSGVDEDALAAVIANARNRWAIYGREGDPFEKFVAHAVAEWLKEQGRGSEM